MKEVEHQHQVALIEWWSYACKGFGLPAFALMAYPAGGLRHKAVAGKMKAAGVRKGVPDLLLPVARGDFYIGLAIELKAYNRGTSDAQDTVIDWLKSQGWRVEVCNSAEGAIKVLKDYLAPSHRSKGTASTPGVSAQPQQ